MRDEVIKDLISALGDKASSFGILLLILCLGFAHILKTVIIQGNYLSIEGFFLLLVVLSGLVTEFISWGLALLIAIVGILLMIAGFDPNPAHAFDSSAMVLSMLTHW